MSMVLPSVVGFKLSGKLNNGVTATDLVLTVTQMLRKHGVVGKFVEFYADRATIANMSPEYGATMGFFPVDKVTLQYLKLTGRSDETVAMIEAYLRANNMFVDYKEGNLISTPPTSETILRGITRKTVIDIARDHGFQYLQLMPIWWDVRYATPDGPLWLGYGYGHGPCWHDGMRDNDWTCPKCGNANLSFRTVCNMRKCNTPKLEPQAEKSDSNSKHKMLDGSWKCEKCNNINYPFRTKCNRQNCGADKPSEGQKSPLEPADENDQPARVEPESLIEATSTRLSYSRFLQYLDEGAVRKVDLFENGSVAIAEVFNPTLNKIQRVKVQFPGLPQELLRKLRKKNVDFAAHPMEVNMVAAILDLLGNLAFPLILLGSLLLRTSSGNTPGRPNLPFGLGMYGD
ncbi:hypothetical protein TEA_005852 [Camellia sinensis var. sinensis]|uniref:RanBP2-type domain-containing protein n=1 Tax=Camellia sinensis var. sinensis TaxID=542762 RepID=A0A4S4EIQ9_CAMSN|nr:hypothetical protein TEA_005852 [Camellia sinensis var. sinensis]